MSRRHLLRLLPGGTVSYEAQGHRCVAIVSRYVGVYNTIAPEIGGANCTVTLFVAAINARLAV
jgi:hypothetical protein